MGVSEFRVEGIGGVFSAEPSQQSTPSKHISGARWDPDPLSPGPPQENVTNYSRKTLKSHSRNNVIYESDIQAMRRIAIESGAHRVIELMDIYLNLKGGSWTSEKENENEDEEGEDLRPPYLP